ncbi:MAG: aspartate/glutamate racemase family protein [Alphaproteobacteria bacterium]|jgi:maleate isomerase/arylmalonate decarboxylase|nr:aspartate/glutamate racemase family protein [Alphaproteobacteria bacterium]
MEGQSTYGWRAKLGLIVPTTNTVNEAEWNLAAPEGVSIHSARMVLHTDLESSAGKAALQEDLTAALNSLAPAGLDAIAYGCTAGSLVTPREALADFMTGVCGLPCVTTGAAIVDALISLNVTSISVATPYDKRLNDHEAEFLEGQGIAVRSIEGLGYGANGPHEYALMHKVPKDEIMDLARRVDDPGAEGLLISCTDLPTFGIIEELEQTLDKPVVTSSQATLWAALAAAGLEPKLPGLGRLLA